MAEDSGRKATGAIGETKRLFTMYKNPACSAPGQAGRLRLRLRTGLLGAAQGKRRKEKIFTYLPNSVPARNRQEKGFDEPKDKQGRSRF